MTLEYNLKNFVGRVAGLWMRCVHLLNFVSEKRLIEIFNVIEYFANGMSGL